MFQGKLVKHFSRQLVIKASFGEQLQRELGDVPCLAQWLRVVGLSPESIEVRTGSLLLDIFPNLAPSIPVCSIRITSISTANDNAV